MAPNLKGETLKELTVDYSTETFPINVKMNVTMLQRRDSANRRFTVTIVYEAQANGQGAIEFDAYRLQMGNSISVVSRWLATGRGTRGRQR